MMISRLIQYLGDVEEVFIFFPFPTLKIILQQLCRTQHMVPR